MKIESVFSRELEIGGYKIGESVLVRKEIILKTLQ